MSVKLTDLGKKLNLTPAQLREKLAQLGIMLKATSRTIDEADALKLEKAFTKVSHSTETDDDVVDNASEASELDLINTDFEKELDKEIIKSQRKMTAGKDTKSKKPVAAAFKSDTTIPTVASEVEISDAITVKEFAEKTGLPPIKVIGELMKNGILANINQAIDFETASIIADDFGIKLRRKRAEATVEDISTGNLEQLLEEKDSAVLQTRPPVVTVMGHVDHGKTSLLDAIRETDVVATEAGGITQHIGAYQIEKNGKAITFIDTPGHEAFTSMRARGARITDIVILVVAADEGVKPQTIEALNHAKEAQVTIIVALNKIDKEGANVDRVKAQLAELDLQPEDWGGKTIMVPVSAATGQGIPTLLEMILLVADMENYRANPNRPAVATILESHLDKSLGPVATIIVNTGTLKLHDPIIVGGISGRVKIMRTARGHSLEQAGPATPAQIAGLPEAPRAGDVLQVVKSIEEARRKSQEIKLLRGEKDALAGGRGIPTIMSAIAAGKLKTLKVVLKADTLGTLEALKLSIAQVKQNEVSVKLIHAAVGNISESDVMMAAASNGIVIGFNTSAGAHVTEVAAQNNVQIFTYQIIYKLIDDLKKILSGLLEPEVTEVILGQAQVRQIFLTEKKYIIVGCKVTSGKVENKAKLRVLRDGAKIGEGTVGLLKKFKDQVGEVSEGNDCGIKYEGDVSLQVGDVLECWKLERKTRIVA